MPKPITARDAALTILTTLRLTEQSTGESIEDLLGRMALPDRDRSLAMELVMGVLRHRLALAAILDRLATHGWDHIDHPLQQILLLGAYQMIYLDGIPDFAAVTEAVKQSRNVSAFTHRLTKRTGPNRASYQGADKFINAVLRHLQRIIDNRRLPTDQADPLRAIPVDHVHCCLFHEAILPDPDQQPIAHLAIATSHPLWMARRWVKAFGLTQTRRICLVGSCRPPLSLRPNRLRTDLQGLMTRLRREIADIEIETDGRHVFIRGGAAIFKSEAFHEGWFQIQDHTAMEVVSAMDPQPGQRIIDLCAGLGTKTTQMAEIMNNVGTILASDKDGRRFAVLTENCARLGINIVQCILPTDLVATVRSIGPVDWILVDAPCSNTGVLARRPDARYRFSPKSLRNLTEIQFNLLKKAAQIATPGTRIAYSTCSLELEENEAVVNRFCRAHPEWRMDDSARIFPSLAPDASIASWRDGGYWALLSSR